MRVKAMEKKMICVVHKGLSLQYCQVKEKYRTLVSNSS